MCNKMQQKYTSYLLLIFLITSSQADAANLIDRTAIYLCKGCIKTGKERLGRKGNDEQRVNDCKVPIEKRGLKVRSAECVKKTR